MSEASRIQLPVSLCVDCITVDANGVGGLPDDHTWTGFLGEWDDCIFAPVIDPETDEPAEPYFSWSPCHGCGSHLGGDRFDYLALLVERGQS